MSEEFSRFEGNIVFACALVFPAALELIRTFSFSRTSGVHFAGFLLMLPSITVSTALAAHQRANAVPDLW
jgi:hypothetical protein